MNIHNRDQEFAKIEKRKYSYFIEVKDDQARNMHLKNYKLNCRNDLNQNEMYSIISTRISTFNYFFVILWKRVEVLTIPVYLF